LGRQVAEARLPGYVQLAGGTNNYTVEKLRELKLLQSVGQEIFVAGIAYGSYARVLLSPLFEQIPGNDKLEDCPDILWAAVDRAANLVRQIKS
jgi:Iron-Sulfur binding protein C terminal